MSPATARWRCDLDESEKTRVAFFPDCLVGPRELFRHGPRGSVGKGNPSDVPNYILVWRLGVVWRLHVHRCHAYCAASLGILFFWCADGRSMSLVLRLRRRRGCDCLGITTCADATRTARHRWGSWDSWDADVRPMIPVLRPRRSRVCDCLGITTAWHLWGSWDSWDADVRPMSPALRLRRRCVCDLRGLS